MLPGRTPTSKNRAKNKLNRIHESGSWRPGKNVRPMKGVVNNNFNMTIIPQRIGFLHLDPPNDAETIWPILKGAPPRLTKGSAIAFQDYAYQFSNELISSLALPEQRENIKAINIAASSIFHKARINTFSADALASILKEAAKPDQINQ